VSATGPGSALQRWLTEPRYASYQPQLRALLERHPERLGDAFDGDLPFGTGGRRGLVGIGPNRINRATVASSVAAHVVWLRRRLPSKDLSVCIGYDVRRFADRGGVYLADVPNPVLGLTSRDLAIHAARAYAEAGVAVWLPSEGHLSTPELSYAVRQLGADGGLVISASHNPPDDNGLKVYGADGGQLVPPADEALLQCVGVEFHVEASAEIRELPDEVREGWCTSASELCEVPPISVHVSALHGAGRVDAVLRRAGVRCTVDQPQSIPDGAFPTIPDGVANPENPGVLLAAAERAGEADLVMGTDPDGDRIGCLVRHAGRWVPLSGQQICVLVVDAALRHWNEDATPVVVATHVTTRLVHRLAMKRRAKCLTDLPVGFKYIGEAMGRLADPSVAFCIGVEESHGVLSSTALRDKDAAHGAMWLALSAGEARGSGMTLVDRLVELYLTHGYLRCAALSARLARTEDRAAVMTRLRAPRTPLTLAGFELRFVEDRLTRGPFGSSSMHAAHDVLTYWLRDDATTDLESARVTFRPSGTEPKLKAYLEIMGAAGLSSDGRARIDRRMGALRDAISGLIDA